MSEFISFPRPLGALEELFLLLDKGAPVHFLVAAEIEGSIGASEWRSSLDALQQRHPHLSACIDLASSRVPHFRQVEGSPIPLRVVEGKMTWEQEAELELRKPFSTDRCPLIRAVLLRQQPLRSTIMLVLHHSAADGISAAYLMRDLLQILSGQTLEKMEPLPSRDQLLGMPPRTSSEPALGTLSGDAALAISRAPISIKTFKLSSELTSRLREQARREKTTLHGALCGAIALAGRKINKAWRNNPLRIASPVSLRELLRIEDQCMVAISSVKSVIEPETPNDLWELARNIRNSLLRYKTLEGNQVPLLALNEAVRGNMLPADASTLLHTAHAAETMVTNLGEVPIQPDYGRFQVRSFWGPCVLRGVEGEQIFGISTIHGSLHIVHISRTPMAGLLDRVEAELIAVAA